ncbi:cytochrome P450 [Mycena crocata]|nr:cytochrome P450 [Mycena crocata]
MPAEHGCLCYKAAKWGFLTLIPTSDMISEILLPIAGTLLCYVLARVVLLAYHHFTSPLRHMVGPKNPSLILGNFRQMADDTLLSQKWREEFGPNFHFKGLFSISELHTSDLKALNHIVTKSTVYQRVPGILHVTRRVLGDGILAVTLGEHKKQRRIMNPAFTVAQVRALTETFVEKAVQLRDMWAAQVARDNGTARVDVTDGLRKMTLDVIGQAGFDYQFNALDTNGKPNDLNEAFTELFHSPRAKYYGLFRLAQGIVPILRLIPMPGSSALQNARYKMDSIGRQLVSNSKEHLQSSDQKNSLQGRRDLLSILLKANLTTDLPEHQRLNESEVVAQIPGFFVAGHETTSSATSWAIHELSVNPSIQSKLRQELLTISTDNPTMDELNTLPYLESFMRETLRVHAPVVFVQRMAMEDDVLPLSKPWVDKQGKSHENLPIRKGQMIHLPILAVNTDKEIWGEDAIEFRPERWEHIPEAASAIPGGWGNLFSFFAGAHKCIGFRFSIIEIKAILFTLVRQLEFENAVPKGEIGPNAGGVVQTPVVLADTANGTALPILVRAVNAQVF